MTASQMMTSEHLLPLIGHPACPALVDVCIDEDVEADPFLIPGAFRHPFTAPERLLERLQGRKAVVICQKGRKLSQGVAAWLRSEGVAARALEGGNLGWTGVRVPLEALPERPVWVAGGALFASVWVIRRFVDREARVLFVTPQEVQDVADRFGAEVLPGFAEVAARFGLSDWLSDFAEALDDDVVRMQLRGLAAIHAGMEAQVTAALPLFDALYQGTRA